MSATRGRPDARRGGAWVPASNPESSDGSLRLEVITARRVLAFPLPASGTIVIGRGENADVVIDEPSVSRRHAILHLGAHVTLRDADSANGTWVRSAPREDDLATHRDLKLGPDDSVELQPGEAFHVGSVLVMLKRGSDPGPAAGVPSEIIVADPVMRHVFDVVARVAPTPLSVLLCGETGVGKEVVAEAIHRGSPRAAGPLVRLNCAALAEQLLESELFGHERGAFTGATTDKPGLFEVARGGTVFLDEVGELPPAVQAKLLRVLEERKVLRVGALAPRPIDVRFVAATHRDIEGEVERGGFRRDLYFRLNGVTIEIPPLRERPGEIDALAVLFLRRACMELGRRDEASLSPEAAEALRRHPWPGNVRELRNVIERAVVLSPSPVIRVEHLGLRVPREGAPPVVPRAATQSAASHDPEVTGSEEEERRRIMDALERCAGNQTLAAEMIGVSRRTLINRLERYGISGPRKRR